MVAALHLLADPTLSYVLFVTGLCALLVEVTHPGALVPGVSGTFLLLLALIGFSALPVNWLSLALILAALALILLDVKVTTHGGPALAGLIAFAAGSLTLFRLPAGHSVGPVSLPVVAAVMLLGLATIGLVMRAAWQVRHVPAWRGPHQLLGRTAEVRTPLQPVGTVYVAGETWTARWYAGRGPGGDAAAAALAAATPDRSGDGSADAPVLPVGQTVRVVGRRGLVLDVEPTVSSAGVALGTAGTHSPEEVKDRWQAP